MSNKSKKPYNILLEVYRLGMLKGISGSFGSGIDIASVENDINDIAKVFGYGGLTDFDIEKLPETTVDKP